MTHLSTRFEEALTWAHRLHQGQRRKQGGAPYIAHLLSVAALILEHGGDEDAAIAGLLHDAAEDQGGVAVLDEARRRFGDRVAEDIAACSDTLIQPKPLWRARKAAHLAELSHASPRVALITAADKLHNARDLLVAVKRDGPAVFDAFKGGREGTLWYYDAVIEILSGVEGLESITALLAQTVAEIKAVCGL